MGLLKPTTRIPLPTASLLLLSPTRWKATMASGAPQSLLRLPASASLLAQIPGPKSYPIVKGLPYFLSNGGGEKLHLYLEKLRNEFGWVSKMEVPFFAAPLLFHPDDIRQAYAADGKYPAAPTDSSPLLAEASRRKGQMNEDLILSELDYWKRMRNALQKHMLPPAAANSYQGLLNPVVREFSEHLPLYQDNIRDILPRFTFEGIGAALFGRRMGAITRNHHPDDEKFIQYALQVFPDTNKFLNQIIPLWRWYDTPALKEFLRKMEFIEARSKFYVDELFEKVKEDPARYSNAFLARLIASKELTPKEMTINVGTMFFAGVDTTSNTLLWIMLHLAQNPEVQERLYQELNSVLRGGDFDEALSSQLPFMKACFKESSRMDPTVPMIPRRPQLDLTLRNGLTIPGGTQIFVCPHANLRDPEIYERPNDYLPERWFDEAKAKRAAQGNTLADHAMMLLNFSFGPRMCIGARFAALEMNCMIARVVQDYRFEVLPGQKPPGKVIRSLSSPEHMPKLKFTKRK